MKPQLARLLAYAGFVLFCLLYLGGICLAAYLYQH